LPLHPRPRGEDETKGEKGEGKEEKGEGLEEHHCKNQVSPSLFGIGFIFSYLGISNPGTRSIYWIVLLFQIPLDKCCIEYLEAMVKV
jgi:hypothetical protein